MRFITMLSAVLLLSLAVARAADISPPVPPEVKALADFTKGINNPEKPARIAAINAFVASKPPINEWPLLLRVAETDPEPGVRLTAYTALAKMPAHNAQVAKMLVAGYEDLKANDFKDRLDFAKAMKHSEFKTDVIAVLADQINKMRWPDEPVALYGQRVTDKAKEMVKEKREELTDMLAVFNEVAKSSVTDPGKDTPAKVRKWWETNEIKFQKIDYDLTAKYAKEDADAAKAAKEAALAAKKN